MTRKSSKNQIILNIPVKSLLESVQKRLKIVVLVILFSKSALAKDIRVENTKVAKFAEQLPKTENAKKA